MHEKIPEMNPQHLRFMPFNRNILTKMTIDKKWLRYGHNNISNTGLPTVANIRNNKIFNSNGKV